MGAIAGFIATGIMKERSSWIKNILLGILGGFVGGLVFGLIGLSAHGLIGSLVVSTTGRLFAGTGSLTRERLCSV